MKNNLPWFTHDNDAASHPKHQALRARYGWEGYGRFWALNEIIARAEDCRLDLTRPVMRASYATELGLSDAEMDDFLAFLADPDRCGLIHYKDGVVTTDRTQDDYVRVHRRRKQDRKRHQPEKEDFRTENDEAGAETDTQHSTAHNSTEQQSTAEDSPAAAVSPEELQRRIRSRAGSTVVLDDDTAADVATVLTRRDCDLNYIDFVLEKMAVKNRIKRIDNPTGFFLQAVSGYDDWLAEYRRKYPKRIRCPDCGFSDGDHSPRCPRVGGREEAS